VFLRPLSGVRQILAAVKAARRRLASLGLDRGSGLPEKQVAGEGTKETFLFLWEITKSQVLQKCRG
jgi:hypothetical protein